MISRVFPNKFLQIYIYFCFWRMSFILKICQPVACISMVHQFHDFLNLILGGFLSFDCAKARARPYRTAVKHSGFKQLKAARIDYHYLTWSVFTTFFMKKSKLRIARLMPEKLVKWQCHKLKNCFFTESLFPFPVQCVMTAADTCMRAHFGIDTVPIFARNCLALDLIKILIEIFFSSYTYLSISC